MRRFHERIPDRRLYRSRNGKLLGVCRGIAEYFDLPVGGTRAVVIILLFVSGFWPIVVLYFVAGLLMKPEPVIPFYGNGEEEFYNSYIHSKTGGIDRLKRHYEILERRLQRLEHTVTSKEYDWDDRLNT
jgi:phage shock protein C